MYKSVNTFIWKSISGYVFVACCHNNNSIVSFSELAPTSKEIKLYRNMILYSSFLK